MLGQIHLLLTDGPSVKCVVYKTFFVFHQSLLKLGDVVLQHPQNKKVLCLTHLTDDLSVKGR